MPYPEIPDTLIALEEETLARWRDEDLFRQTLEATAHLRDHICVIQAFCRSYCRVDTPP